MNAIIVKFLFGRVVSDKMDKTITVVVETSVTTQSMVNIIFKNTKLMMKTMLLKSAYRSTWKLVRFQLQTLPSSRSR